jgi:hypothetical protein
MADDLIGTIEENEELVIPSDQEDEERFNGSFKFDATEEFQQPWNFTKAKQELYRDNFKVRHYIHFDL